MACMQQVIIMAMKRLKRIIRHQIEESCISENELEHDAASSE